MPPVRFAYSSQERSQAEPSGDTEGVYTSYPSARMRFVKLPVTMPQYGRTLYSFLSSPQPIMPWTNTYG